MTDLFSLLSQVRVSPQDLQHNASLYSESVTDSVIFVLIYFQF